MIKVGVFGAGHLGKIHIEQWLTLPGVALVGFFDPNDTNALSAKERFGIKRFDDAESLIKNVDAVDIVTTTISHFKIAKFAILNGKHIFIEKPITNTLEEAEELVRLVEEAKVKCQVGHVERYNPAFLALKDVNIQPLFIEAHRLSTFNPRGTDVSVILDLMIHDLDIILSIVKSPVKRIAASGVAVVSATPDIANARIEFENGCVANVTSSRISLKKMRKTRIFQKDAYISIDFLNKETEIVRLQNEHEEKEGFSIALDDFDRNIIINKPTIHPVNAIQQELADFIYTILTDAPVNVSIYDGQYALQIAHKILDRIKSNTINP